MEDEVKIQWPQDASPLPDNKVNRDLPVMSADPADQNKMVSVSVGQLADQAAQSAAINGQRIKSVPAGALPAQGAGPVYMHLRGPGTWTFGGNNVVTLDTDEEGDVWWNGTVWSLDSKQALPAADTSGLLEKGGYDGTAEELYVGLQNVESGLEDKADTINEEGRVYRSQEISDEIVYTNVPPANDYGNASGYYHNGTGGSGTPASVQAASNRKRMDFDVPDASKQYYATGSVIGGLRVSLVVYVDPLGNYLGQQLPVAENVTESFTKSPLTLPTGTAKILGSSINNAVIIIETGEEVITYDDPLPASQTYTRGESNALLDQKASEINNNGKIIRGEQTEEIIYSEVEGQSPTGGPVVTGNGYINRSTGAVVASTTRKVIFFPIDPANFEYDITTNMSATNQMALAVYYDANRNQIKNSQGQAQDGLSYENPFSASGDVQFTNRVLSPPANAAFIGTTNQNTRTITLRRKQVLIGYEQAIFQNDPVINPFLQRNILSVGDSIIKANEIGNYGFLEYIASEYSMNLVNRAVGGATMAVVSGSTNNIPNQIDNAISAGLPVPDFVIFDGLTNDISGSSTVQLGDIALNYLEASFDKSTFSGGMEYVIRKIRTTWLSTKIVYVRVHKMSSRDTAKQQTFGDRAQAICNKWGVKVIDIFNEGQLNAYLPEMYDVFTNNSDRTHPNLEGYKQFYVPPTIDTLKSLVYTEA